MAPLPRKGNNSPLRVRDDDLPPARRFVDKGETGWSAHPAAPEWLYKRSEKVYFHEPTSTLWSRRTSGTMVRLDGAFGLAAMSLAAAYGPPLRTMVAAWRAVAASASRWRDCRTDDLGDEAPRPPMPIAAKGRRIRKQRGVSPPPSDDSDGWEEMGRGWQRHLKAPKWLRKPAELDGTAYFYIPQESLWTRLPNGPLIRVDAYQAALTAFSSFSGHALAKQCLIWWKSFSHVTKLWRYKINLFSLGHSNITNSDAYDAYSSAEEARFTSSDALIGALCSDDVM